MSGKALSLWTNTKILSCSPIHRLPIVWTFTLAVARREPDHLCMLPAATVLIFACAWTKMYHIMEHQFMMLSYHLFRWNFMTVDTDIKFYFPKSLTAHPICRCQGTCHPKWWSSVHHCLSQSDDLYVWEGQACTTKEKGTRGTREVLKGRINLKVTIVLFFPSFCFVHFLTTWRI